MGSQGSKQQAPADHYTLLGLGDSKDTSTPEQIRKAYLKNALKYHPDKLNHLIGAELSPAAREAKKEEIDTHFKNIVAAYEVLSDPVQRHEYDTRRIYGDSSSSSGGCPTRSSTSTPTPTKHHHQQQEQQHHDVNDDDFDDEIPTDCAPGDFFKVFGPVFERNARWSAEKPVPGLGNNGTPMEEVDEFYEFWYSFKSSKQFDYQYKRKREWAMRQECIRIRRLAHNAYRKDPRILRRKEEEKAEKERKKKEKEMRKEAEARAAEEERRRREEEEKRAEKAALEQKKVKERERKLLNKERSRFRTFLSESGCLEKDDVERLCIWFDFEKLRNVCEIIEDGKDEGIMDRLSNIVSEIKREEDEEKKNKCSSDQQETQKANESNDNGNGSLKERPWGKEEIELLRKGMVKFPKGTPRRWEVVSEYIGTGRSVEEVLKAMKTVLLKKPDDRKAFDSFLEKRKPSKSIDSPLTTRTEVEGLSTTYPVSTSTSASPPPNDQKSASPSSSEQDDVWSVEQERSLIQAMKTVPKELSGNAQWERVAAAVTEKTANQCKTKFAVLKQNLRSKKSSA